MNRFLIIGGGFMGYSLALDIKFKVLKYYEYIHNKRKIKEIKSWIISVDHSGTKSASTLKAVVRSWRRIAQQKSNDFHWRLSWLFLAKKSQI